jgi:hypothetical protein
LRRRLLAIAGAAFDNFAMQVQSSPLGSRVFDSLTNPKPATFARGSVMGSAPESTERAVGPELRMLDAAKFAMRQIEQLDPLLQEVQ